MDWKKIAPWNWFKDEQARSGTPLQANTVADPAMPFRAEIDQMLARAFATWAAGTDGSAPTPLRPSVDISEGKKAYTIRADLPGIDPGDISVAVEGNTLAIRAERQRESEEEDEGYHCVERSYGLVQRVLSLPDDADPEAIEAKFKNGALKLTVPKHPARASDVRTIEVQHG